jgi:hypothetical protein
MTTIFTVMGGQEGDPSRAPPIAGNFTNSPFFGIASRRRGI